LSFKTRALSIAPQIHPTARTRIALHEVAR
jgi:hypothetical protein